MADFNLIVGMSKSSVLNQLDSMNTTEVTRNKIINFLENDKDKKISNEIELAMIKSWANGSEQIEMPSSDGMKKKRRSQIWPEDYKILTEEGGENNYYTAFNNRIMGVLNAPNGKKTVFTSIFGRDTKAYYMDSLVDENGDGYADYRVSYKTKVFDPITHYIDTSFTDRNLDGVFDETHEGEFKNGKYAEQTVQTERVDIRS